MTDHSTGYASRPKLHRNNASAQPALPGITSSMTLESHNVFQGVSASADATPHPSPRYPLESEHRGLSSSYFDTSMPLHRGNSSLDMIRGGSLDLQRPLLKSKSSRKELKDSASRSASPLTTRQSKMTKFSLRDKDREEDGNSFECAFSAEFDRQRLDRERTMERNDPSVHQKWLDALFRKLCQKTNAKTQRMSLAHQGHLHLGSLPQDQSGHDPPENGFLDFTTYINPIPTPGANTPSQQLLVNRTPRPADFQQFSSLSLQHLEDQTSELPRQSTLRAQKSENSLITKRRLQRQPSQGVPLSSALDIAQETTRTPLAKKNKVPIPQLPEWARSSNRMLQEAVQLDSDMHVQGMTRAYSHGSPSSPVRSAEMQRSATHETGQHTHASSPSGNKKQYIRAHQPLCIYAQDTGSPSPFGRSSVSSVTSDSGTSSSISSVPQTPVSKFAPLSLNSPTVRRGSQTSGSAYPDMLVEESKDFHELEYELPFLSSVHTYHSLAQSEGQQQKEQNGQENQEKYPSSMPRKSSLPSLEDSPCGLGRSPEIKRHLANAHPRTMTTSEIRQQVRNNSVQKGLMRQAHSKPTPSSPKTSRKAPDGYSQQSRLDPRASLDDNKSARSSSLHGHAQNASISSTISSSSSSSSSSFSSASSQDSQSGSGSDTFLSYMKSSPKSLTNLRARAKFSPKKGENRSESPINDEWAASLGRRLARGIGS